MTLHLLRLRRPVVCSVLLVATLTCVFGLAKPAFGEVASTDCVLSVTLSSQNGSCAVDDAGSLSGTFSVPFVPAQMIEVQACANGACAYAPFEVLRCGRVCLRQQPPSSPELSTTPASSSPTSVVPGIYKVHTREDRAGPQLVPAETPQVPASLAPSLVLTPTAGAPGARIVVSGSDFGAVTTTTPTTTPPTKTPPTTGAPPSSAIAPPPLSDPATSASAASQPAVIPIRARAASSGTGRSVWLVIILLIALVAVAAGGWLRLRPRQAPAGRVEARLRGHTIAASPQLQDLGDRPALVVRFEPHHQPVAPRIEEVEVRR